MMMFQFVWETLQGLPEYYQREKGLFLFTLGLVGVIAIFHLVKTIRTAGQIKSLPIRIVYFLVELIGIFAVLLSGVLFNRAGEIGELKPEMLNWRFFLEIIVAAVVYIIFYWRLYVRQDEEREKLREAKAWSSWDEEEYSETVSEYGKSMLRAIGIIVASVIGIFAGTSIIKAGPVLFGKRLGEWAFNTYAAWIVNVIVTFVSILIELPLIKLFGNKVMQAMDAYEDAIDEHGDAISEKYLDPLWDKWDDFKEKWKGRRSEKSVSNRTSASHARRMTKAEIGAKAGGSTGSGGSSRKQTIPWKGILAVAVLVVGFFLIRGFFNGNSSESLPVNSSQMTERDVKTLQKQSSEGNLEAMTRLAEAYQYGWGGLAKDQEEAVSLYRQAAEAGYAEAQYQMGRVYDFGNGEEQNYDEAFAWYMRAAEQGHASAQREVGLFYSMGRSVRKDYTEAMNWYKLEAEQNEPYALRDLGLMYARGDGVEADTVEAMWYYMQAVEQGYIGAYHDLGNLYLIYNMEREPDKAAEWFAKGAEAGDSFSAFDLAKMYETGDGVEQSYAKAFDLYMQYSDYHSEAQYNLGRYYEEGLGVEADREQAIAWYQKAADLGHQKAKEALERYY